MHARPSLHRRTPQTMIMTDTDTDTSTPPIPTDGDKPVKPSLTAVSLGSAVQLQLRLGSGSDENDHDGDDEQDYNRDDDDSERSLLHSRSGSDSPVPHTPVPPAQQQQQQQQLQPTSTSATPTTSPCAAHVHFHSRVRITSGLRRSRGNRTLGDSSDSDSPSSSISAPLHYHSRSTAPLVERVSRLASQALQKRRLAAVASSTITASRRFRTRSHHGPEYTPFLRAGVPVSYGTAQRGYSGVAGDVDSEDENVSQLDDSDLHGEDGIPFRRWPWRALNRQVSNACVFIFSLPKRLVHDGDHSVQWWKWQVESALCCHCSDESDNDG
jgi:hypothetical protein